jgi:hypothetical protein
VRSYRTISPSPVPRTYLVRPCKLADLDFTV